VIATNGRTSYRPFFNPYGEAAYIETYVPNHPAAAARAGWVALHRVVLENKLGRYLTQGRADEVHRRQRLQLLAGERRARRARSRVGDTPNNGLVDAGATSRPWRPSRCRSRTTGPSSRTSW
jgi:hypothetical protein